jgi:demethylmenaquinone methyltransferase / 2-methoxy-6-polyprenyl-1,4-benzoquinol methylase
MPADDRPEVVARIFSAGTGAHYDWIVEKTTKGMDQVWKEALLARVERAGRVLDLACGTGILTYMFRERFPECEVVGVDVSPEYLEIARERARERGDDKVSFVLGLAEEAPLTGRFDVITSCYLPKYADLSKLVPRLTERLEEGGLLIMQDFAWPRDPAVARALTWRFKKLVEWARRERPEAVGMFETVPIVVQRSQWLDEMMVRMREHGLEGVGREFLDREQAALVWGRKPGSRAA